MDELKHKFLDLLNKKGHHSQQSLSSPKLELVVNTSQDDQISIVKESQNNGLKQTEVEPLADQEILESIEQQYFSDSNFDPCEHVLREVPEILDCASIVAESEKIQKQLQVVSNNVLQLILQKQSICNDEFERILEIQKELQSTLKICQIGRSHLFLAKRQFTTASLGILANYRKRQVVQGLLHYLQTIKTLQRTDERLQELLSEGDYPSAIRLLLECQNAAATYKHFTCVAALSGKLQDTLEMAEEQLDQALSQVCKHFDADHYSKVYSAYKLLGKMQMAMDQMHMHFASAIHNSAFNVVHGYVELCFVQTHGEDPVILHKKQFRELCKFVTAESFIPCLLDLCKALWEIMKSYHKVIIWQQRNDSDKLTADGAMENVDFEASFNKEYVKQKLENGLARIWQDVQSRISVYLLGSDLAWYKFDEFLQVLGIVHRLMEVGEEFCGSKSTDLQNSIRTQSMNYFINYHQSRLDELRIFLENEGWEICPVKPNFTILRLQEFGSLRHILKYWKNDLSSQGQLNMSSPECSSNHSQDDSSLSGGYFARYSDSGSPFDISQDEVQEEDILANIGLQDEPSGYFSDESDEDIPEELTKDFVDENMGDTASNKHSKPTSKKNIHVELLKAPILTNTALTVLRQCGKYLQMSHLLRPIACDVITCMSQLFEYYLYTVYSFFANDLPVSCHSMFNLKLQATLKRIKDKLILSDQDQEQKPSEINKRKILPPQMSTGVELNQAESLYGLAERVVAVESLVFLAKQFKFLQSYLEHLIPHNSPVTGNSAPLHHFYSQTILVATELRRPVYMNVCARAVDFNTTLNSMAKVNWEVKEVMSQHSQYVDNLLRDLQIFSMRLEEVSCRVPLSPDILNILWENVAYLCCNTFVEGFSNAKKCSNGGRALMQLDFTQFLSKFEKLTSIKPIPNREFVEAYVKAYYQPDTELEAWIKEHSEYSTKQLLALVNCSCHNNKKARQHLFSLLEELEKVNR